MSLLFLFSWYNSVHTTPKQSRPGQIDRGGFVFLFFVFGNASS